MPLYEYRCTGCGELMEVLRPSARAAPEMTCTGCGAMARRAMSTFATVSAGGEEAPGGSPSGGSSGCGGCGGACACSA